MPWTVLFHPEFRPEFEAFPLDIQDELLSRLRTLAQFGPTLGRPNVDTLKGSSFQNMKELRFQKDGVWRFAFIFDPLRQVIVLTGGNKENVDQARFYRALIATADGRFSAYLVGLKEAKPKE
jgi:hypothetical protein